MSLKLLQTNLARGKKVHDLAYATTKQTNVDILSVGEQNKKIADGKKWTTYEGKDVAVLFVNRSIMATKVDVRKRHIHMCEFW